MKFRVQGIRAGLASAAAAATTMVWALPALASELRVGQPTPGAIGLQPGVTPLRHDAAFFHNVILLPIITVITLFVLALLVWVMFRYNKKANPTPAKWSHNTTIEVVWTIVPVLILVFIAIFSFRLLYAYHDMPKPYMTVKATGYQWYWGYEYPDNGISEVVSNVLPEDKAKAQKVPYLLATTEPLVVPVGKPVRVQVTGADVIHAFARARLRDHLRRRPRSPERDLVHHREARRLLRKLPRALRGRARLHADRGARREPGRV